MAVAHKNEEKNTFVSENDAKENNVEVPTKVEEDNFYKSPDLILLHGAVENTFEVPTKVEENSSKKSRDPDLLHVAVVFITILTVALLVALLTVTIRWSQRRNENLKPMEHEICLDCKVLRSKYDPTNSTDEFQRKENECCGPASKIYKRLIDKATREKYVNDLSSNFFAHTGCSGPASIPEKPSAKVAGISFVDMKQDQSSLNVIHWNRTGPLTFFKAKIHYTEGRLQVDQPGHYYIFSQLKWSLNNSYTLPISHEMHLHSFQKGVYEVLLESRKTKCNLVDDTGEATSALGAVFKLDRGDKIFVTSSKPEALASCHHGNFFGLYHVAELQTKT